MLVLDERHHAQILVPLNEEDALAGVTLGVRVLQDVEQVTTLDVKEIDGDIVRSPSTGLFVSSVKRRLPMRRLRIWLVSFFVCTGAIAASAENTPLDCSKKSLADAVLNASDKNQTISFTGVCAGPIVISTDGLILKGVGTAVIDGGGENAVTVAGTSRVSLIDLEVTNGLNGIVARQGAQLSLSGVSSHNNSQTGVLLQTAAIADFSDVSVTNNGGNGLVADNGVGITLADSTITGNGSLDIQLTFATRVDLRTLTFGTYACDATVLAGNERHRVPALDRHPEQEGATLILARTATRAQ